jgi:hypothetical protein
MSLTTLIFCVTKGRKRSPELSALCVTENDSISCLLRIRFGLLFAYWLASGVFGA